jgi:hypothetical protein
MHCGACEEELELDFAADGKEHRLRCVGCSALYAVTAGRVAGDGADDEPDDEAPGGGEEQLD